MESFIYWSLIISITKLIGAIILTQLQLTNCVIVSKMNGSQYSILSHSSKLWQVFVSFFPVKNERLALMH